MRKLMHIVFALALTVVGVACGNKPVEIQEEVTPEQQQAYERMQELMQRQQQMSQEALQRQMQQMPQQGQ